MARNGLQTRVMRARGLGWKAEPCGDPRSCEADLCVADDEGQHWHPSDPLAFAKWRVRARPDTIPAALTVRTWWPLPSQWVKRGALVGAIGLGSAAAALTVWLARSPDRSRAYPA